MRRRRSATERDLDFSGLALTDTLIVLAEAVLQGMPFRIQQYGSSYALLQLAAVREIVTSQQWGAFSAQVMSSHARMEQLRQSPWQAMIPGLAGTPSQLQGDVQSLTAAVVQQAAAAQAQQAAAAQAQQAQGAAGTRRSWRCSAGWVRPRACCCSSATACGHHAHASAACRTPRPAAGAAARRAPAGGLQAAVQRCAHCQGGV